MGHGLGLVPIRNHAPRQATVKAVPHNPSLPRRVWICFTNYRQWRRARRLSAACFELRNMEGPEGDRDRWRTWGKLKTIQSKEWDKLFTQSES